MVCIQVNLWYPISTAGDLWLNGFSLCCSFFKTQLDVTFTVYSFIVLKCSWCLILGWFQIYCVMIWYLHTLWNDHHMSNSHLSSFTVVIILLIIFLTLCIPCSCLPYYRTGGLSLLIPLSYFVHSLHPSLLSTTQFSSVSEFVFTLFCFLDSIYKWDHVEFVFFCLIWFA